MDKKTRKPVDLFRAHDLDSLEGVPQGANFSPIVALLALEKSLMEMDRSYYSIMYADDGLL